jgi:hypothetical protein
MSFSNNFNSFCPNLSQEVIVPYLPTILTGATSLINEATEDTLHLILDTLYVTAKVDPTVTAKYEAIITPYVLSVWSKHSNDPMIATVVMVTTTIIILQLIKKLGFVGSTCELSRLLPTSLR